MTESGKYQKAVQAFDDANSRDPNMETVDGKEYPAEVLYSRRMTNWLGKMDPDASEELHLAARCQHIERWTIPREEYPMTRVGYIKWRNELKKYHAQRAEEILSEAGYDDDTIQRVKDLVMKKGIRTDPEAQMLEDVICLVFLESYFEEFAQKHEDEKLINILKKTWRKMSEKGQARALQLDLPERLRVLVEQAIRA